MYIKWIGAILIIAGCGGFGFYLAASHRAEELALYRLINALDYMHSELQYKLTPLPQLCKQVSTQTQGIFRSVFRTLGEELERQVLPDVSQCMEKVIHNIPAVPDSARRCLHMLGNSLGKFELKGQLQGLENVLAYCKQQANRFSKNRDVRLRSYQTLGLCAGAALAVLLI